MVNKIVRVAKEIPQHPYIGRVVPERERFVYSYRLIYKVGETDILIVAIVHGKRLLENIDERFE